MPHRVVNAAYLARYGRVNSASPCCHCLYLSLELRDRTALRKTQHFEVRGRLLDNLACQSSGSTGGSVMNIWTVRQLLGGIS